MTTSNLLPDGCRWVPTSNNKLLKKQLDSALAMQGICGIDGSFGTGKTSSTLRLLRAQSLPHVSVQIDPAAANGELIRALMHELNINPESDNVWRWKQQLAHALCEQPMIVRLVEAQRTPLKFLEQLRTIHDHEDAKFTLILEGNGILKRVQRSGALTQRMAFPVPFTYLDSDELDTWLRKYHPMYKTAPAALLRSLDVELSLLRSIKGDNSERGCLRHWAGFTFALLRRCVEKGIEPELIEELAISTVGRYAYVPEQRATDE